MKLEEIKPNEFGQPGGWNISDWETVDQLLDFRDTRKLETPDQQLLFILDDIHQASYTSMHATTSGELDSVPDGYLTEDEQASYDSECKISLAQRTKIVIGNLTASIEQTTLDLNSGNLIPIDEDEVDLVNLHNQTSYVFNSPALCKKIVASDPSMAIAAHPNGYFADDLNPAENYLLAEHMRNNFGYEILGLGSFLAAYVRPEPFDKGEVTTVIESIRGLYMEMTDEKVAQWANIAADRRWFLLSYRGS